MPGCFGMALLAVLAATGSRSTSIRPSDASSPPPGSSALRWPRVQRQMRPWTRWWWLGSAVGKANLTRLLETYRQAGLGGMEITPIYGVRGQEARDIPYLSPQWMEMLRYTVAEAHRLDMGVDMATGTGWPFGGPQVTEEDSLDMLVIEMVDGRYKARIRWSGRKVKRAAPGGEGRCINPFSRESLAHYLPRFDAALAPLPPGAIRCQFHDSFEYAADWAPLLLDEFRARRGYDLGDHLAALAGEGDPDEVARVRTDYRETISDMLLENFTEPWTVWAHSHGSLSRNQAHGSPGNLLDLYGAADIPETEVFRGIGDPRMSKFASSAAHVLGKPLASSETCTWMSEHFTETLAQAKRVIDRLLLSGINHVVYHGTAYSPSDAAWPGWLFYASTHFQPGHPLWRDFPVLNAYVTRCQSVLQSGRPDNDVLLYWPLHDLWQEQPKVFGLTIEGRWLESQPVGYTARMLWDNGFAFDYVSDRQLLTAEVKDAAIRMAGGTYRVVLVPPCRFMPLETLRSLLRIAEAGGTVLFEGFPPRDVPGLANLEERRRALHALEARIVLKDADLRGLPGIERAELGRGRILAGPDAGALLGAAGVRQELLTAVNELMFIRRAYAGGWSYLLVNQRSAALNGWVELAVPARSAVLMDPMTGRTGVAEVRPGHGEKLQVYLHLAPGESVILRALAGAAPKGPEWSYWRAAGPPVPLDGRWRVQFVEGGPVLPKAYDATALGSWTAEPDPEAERFAGTARYTLTFNAPLQGAGAWMLDLGDVRESARVSLNGHSLGTLIGPPYRIPLPRLKPAGNVLEVEVTNAPANRIRDMDRRNVPWRIFHDINFVNIDYKPFDASGWPVRASGLLGPVTLTPMTRMRAGQF